MKKEEIEHIAELAKLELTDEEKELFIKQLPQIIEYVNKLNELDTENVEPLYHFDYLKNVTRSDIAHAYSPSWAIKDALSNAPQTQDCYFKVPKIIE